MFVLATAGVLALVGTAYGVEEYMLLALAAPAAVVSGAALAACSRRRARRTLLVEILRPDGELVVGMPATACIVLANAGRRPLAGLRVDPVHEWTVSFPGFPGALLPPRSAPARDGGVASRAADAPRRRSVRGRKAPVSVPVPVLEPGERIVVAVTVPTDRRGLWSLGSRRVWCLDPLGLSAWPATASPPLHVVVCPSVRGGGQETASSEGAGRSDVVLEAHGHTRRSRGEGDELAGLRGYVPGDRLNRLHWPVMARTGELVVRDFVEPEARRLEVVVDDRPPAVDEAVTSSAARALTALDAGTVVDLVTRSGHRLTVVPGPLARTTALEALAVVAPAVAGRR